MKFMKLCRTDIKILLALQQDVRTYAGNLIYGVRLQVNGEINSLNKSFSASCIALKIKFVSDGHIRDGSLNLHKAFD